jgi:hypothetical protein
MLATFSVTSTDDLPVNNPGDAPGTLRQAIFDANALMGIDDIVFDLAPGAAITLDEGHLTVTESVNILGPGAANLIIDASGNDSTPDENEGNGSRIIEFSLAAANEATIVGLTLTGGDEFLDGGAISLIGSLTISDCVLIDNASNRGGAIFVAAGSVLDILDTLIEGNNAFSAGGGIFAEHDTETLISESQIIDNEAGNETYSGDQFGGGIAVIATPEMSTTNLTLQRTLVSNNRTPHGVGGGIAYYNLGSGNFIIRESRIFSNLADDGSRWSTNEPPDPSIGPGGGGVYALTLGSVLISDSTIDNNIAYGRGGGLDLLDSMATIINTTISANQSMEGGGVSASNALIKHSTITANRAGIRPEVMLSEPFTTGGGGLHVGGFLEGGTAGTVLDHTIIAGNFHEWDSGNEWLRTFPFDGYVSPDVGYVNGSPGEDVSLPANYTIIGTTAGALSQPQGGGILVLTGTGNQTNVDPLLGPLADNGGFRLPDSATIPTHALLEGSPAIDRGDPSFTVPPPATDPEFDERGTPFVRVFDAILALEADIDIGAFEFQSIDEPCPPGDYNDDGTVDAADYVMWRKLTPNVSGSDLANDLTPESVGTDDYDTWVVHFGEVCVEEAHVVQVTSEEAAIGSALLFAPENGRQVEREKVNFEQAHRATLRVIDGRVELPASQLSSRSTSLRIPAVSSIDAYYSRLRDLLIGTSRSFDASDDDLQEFNLAEPSASDDDPTDAAFEGLEDDHSTDMTGIIPA